MAPRTSLADAIRMAYQGQFTQAQLAATLGVAQNTISRWSTGDVEPRLDDIAAIETACGLPRGQILRRAGYLDDAIDVEEYLATDTRLDPPRRSAMVTAYRSAVAESKRRR